MKGTSDGEATDPVIAAKGYAHPDAPVSAVRAPIETGAPK